MRGRVAARCGLYALLLQLLAACDIVVGLRELERPDAAPDRPPLCVAHGPDHDEDGDAASDACDPCPGVAPPETYSDADALPDACDPRPQIDGDHDLEFVSFTEANAAMRWAPLDAAWTVEDDQLRFASTTASYDVIRQQAGLGERTVITARIEIDATTNVLGMIGVVANIHGTNNDGVTCAVRRQGNGETSAYGYDDVTQLSAEAGVLPAMTVGAAYLIELSYAPSTLLARCRVRALGDPVVERAIAIPLTLPPAAGYLGFEGAAISARVEYVSLQSWTD